MAEFTMDLRAMSSPSASDGSTRLNSSQREQVIETVQEVRDRTQQQTVQAEQRASEAQSVDKGSVAEVIEKINQSPSIRNTSLQFVFDEQGEPPVVKVMDQESGEMIRQIPSELAVKLSKAIEELADNQDSRSGILFDKQV